MDIYLVLVYTTSIFGQLRSWLSEKVLIKWSVCLLHCLKMAVHKAKQNAASNK